MNIDTTIRALESQRTSWNMSAGAIQYICDYLISLNAPTVLEIGTYNGFSALHWAKFAGHVTTLERDHTFAATAQKNFDGVDGVTLIVGDALHTIDSLDLFNVIIIDAQKSQYKEYLQKALEHLDENGIIFLDNTISHKSKLVALFDFLESSNLDWVETGVGQGLIKVSRK